MQQAPGPALCEWDFADPFVLHAGGRYFAYATNARGCNVQVMESQDLRRWEHRGDALPDLPPWAVPGRTWAPVVLARAGGSYVLYYTAAEPTAGYQAIGAAVANQPQGPFVDGGAGPLIYQLEAGGSIDPSPFVDGDGTAYLLWKCDANAMNRPSSLWIRALSPDGLRLVGEPTELLRHDRSWERPLIEAPAMVARGGTYYLFYSANWWESAGYAIGYATGPGPRGPFRKVTRRRAWLVSGDDGVGPGGQEFFTDTEGGLRMAYHAWAPGSVGYARGGRRSLRIARISFVNGEPVAEA